MKIRLATPDDAEAIAAIYAPIVRETAISFEVAPPTAADLAGRIYRAYPRYPWLVADVEGTPAGYCYAGSHRKRSAYRWSVESSVYVDTEVRRAGVGRALYERLFDTLRAQDYANVYAGIVQPNEASMAFHQACGFEEVGLYRRVGFRKGRWRDVWWGRLDLMPDRTGRPSEPKLLTELG